ncbi:MULTISPECIES: SMC-Scp complex subunit ScpB [unclassified Aeromicrobium]|uniref:SMC-Scp complex subunit ScpB n=1 Tax=unclassified Aeromicrobium TaxID=2633570 RepID=UPI00396B0352
MTETDDHTPEPGATDEQTEADTRPPVELRPALEAVLMIADEPLDHLVLAQAVGHPPTDVEQALRALAAEYAEQGRGFELRELAGGWRFYSREEFADVVSAFVLEGQQARLSQAALETLAVVAYRQPISRSRISAIRGVNVDGVVRTLVTRGLIVELGHDAESGAILYGTTNYFLERMGLSGLDELPELAPMLPDLEDLDGELERVAQQTAEREAVPAEDAPAAESAETTGGVGG